MLKILPFFLLVIDLFKCIFLKKKNYRIKITNKTNFELEYSHYSINNFEPNNDSIFIYFHGLPGAPLNELSYIPNLLGSIGFDTICFNYPGVWNENGYFSYADVIAGIQGLMNHIKTNQNVSSFNLFGESLGGAVALHLLERGSEFPINKIILRSPTLDLKPIVNLLPMTFQYLRQAKVLHFKSIQSLLKDISVFDPTQYYEKINNQKETKIWGVIGENDEIIPPLEMLKAVKNYPTINVELWKDFPHNDIDDQVYQRFISKLKDFMSN